MHVAITQVDLTRLRLSEPARPCRLGSGQAARTGRSTQFGDTSARDLVQSLIDLLNVQNDFLSVWVNYEVQDLSSTSISGSWNSRPRHPYRARGAADALLTMLPNTMPSEVPARAEFRADAGRPQREAPAETEVQPMPLEFPRFAAAGRGWAGHAGDAGALRPGGFRRCDPDRRRSRTTESATAELPGVRR